VQALFLKMSNFDKISRKPLNSSGIIISGLLFGFFALTIFLIGFYPLLSIKTPETFARHPIAIGKES
jgi:hypothetical protein